MTPELTEIPRRSMLFTDGTDFLTDLLAIGRINDPQFNPSLIFASIGP
jgi:hypothetical protein